MVPCFFDILFFQSSELASKYVVPAFEFCTTLEDYQRVFYNLKKYCYYSGKKS